MAAGSAKTTRPPRLLGRVSRARQRDGGRKNVVLWKGVQRNWSLGLLGRGGRGLLVRGGHGRLQRRPPLTGWLAAAFRAGLARHRERAAGLAVAMASRIRQLSKLRDLEDDDGLSDDDDDDEQEPTRRRFADLIERDDEESGEDGEDAGAESESESEEGEAWERCFEVTTSKKGATVWQSRLFPERRFTSAAAAAEFASGRQHMRALTEARRKARTYNETQKVLQKAAKKKERRAAKAQERAREKVKDRRKRRRENAG